MARRSVIVKGNVKEGEIITENNITTKRPLLNDSVPAMKYYNVIGKSFKRDLVDDSILKWDDINE
jgi:N,N'-diacetyllegionaminate synthase